MVSWNDNLMLLSNISDTPRILVTIAALSSDIFRGPSHSLHRSSHVTAARELSIDDTELGKLNQRHKLRQKLSTEITEYQLECHVYLNMY